MNGLLRFTEAVKHDTAIDLWLDKQAKELGSIGRMWFARMRERGEDVREALHDGFPVACVKDAPFAYVNIFKTHVNVGFFLGASLPDPSGLLEGSGKRMRHVKIIPGCEPDFAALSALIDAAYLDMRARVAAD